MQSQPIGMPDEGCKVLVAEDDSSLRLLFSLSLKQGGFDIVEAFHGADALEKALAEKPPILVLDNRMPCMSGVEVLSALRERNIPCYAILVTAASEARRLAAAHGFDDFLEKPVSPRALIEAAIRGRRVRDTNTHVNQN